MLLFCQGFSLLQQLPSLGKFFSCFRNAQKWLDRSLETWCFIYIYICCEWLAAPSTETLADPVSFNQPAASSLFYAPKLQSLTGPKAAVHSEHQKPIHGLTRPSVMASRHHGPSLRNTRAHRAICLETCTSTCGFGPWLDKVV